MLRAALHGVLLATVSLIPARAGAQAHSQGNLMHATGTFNVTMGKAESSPIGASAGIGRMTIDKTWAGDITGTSKGEMLSTATPSGAMAYVALETVTATVNGHAGTFVFQHNATMQASDPTSAKLDVTIMPNSGTAALTGIAGTLTITIDSKGLHTYNLTYTLPEK